MDRDPRTWKDAFWGYAMAPGWQRAQLHRREWTQHVRMPLSPWGTHGLTQRRSEYDFLLFNTIAQGGNVTVNTLVSTSLNSQGDDRPLGIALQIDEGAPQTSFFVPAATPGNLPDAWDGTDGWVANSIIEVPMLFTGIAPGAHTLKVRLPESLPVVVLTVASRFG